MKHIYISSCDESGGIYHFIFQDGKLVLSEKTPLDRPMYTVVHKGKLYVLLREIDKETHFGGVRGFDIDDNGKLINPSEIVSTRGVCPCHIEVTDNDIYIANYLSGNIVSVKGKEDMHSGCGVNLPRQDMPHTHYVHLSPDKKYLLSCDLGLDSIYTYDFDLNIRSVAKAPKGEGARHLAYSEDKKYIYCVNELGSSVSVFSYCNGKAILKNTYSCISEHTKDNTSAAVRVKNNYLYVSNRGEDTLVCFKIEDDSLEFKSKTNVGGEFPRDFMLFDDYLICTNEHTNNVTLFSVKKEILTQIDSIENIADPLCVTVI